MKIILPILILLTTTAYSQEKKKVVMTEYIQEVQQWQKDGREMALTFWIPKSYWRVALEDSPTTTEETIQLLEEAFEDYLFVCILKFDMVDSGNMSFVDESTIRKGLTASDKNGKKLSLMKDKDIPESTLKLIESLKPLFEKMLGQMGAGMHFYLFDNLDKNGYEIIDEYKKETLFVHHSDQDFKFELPLVTLMPDKYCPIDNAVMKGNWNYCPIHGMELD
ncbi:MAG: hypothetical protein ACSHXL_03780 [Bacteroidota bacterium]